MGSSLDQAFRCSSLKSNCSRSIVSKRQEHTLFVSYCYKEIDQFSLSLSPFSTACKGIPWKTILHAVADPQQSIFYNSFYCISLQHLIMWYFTILIFTQFCILCKKKYVQRIFELIKVLHCISLFKKVKTRWVFIALEILLAWKIVICIRLSKISPERFSLVWFTHAI